MQLAKDLRDKEIPQRKACWVHKYVQNNTRLETPAIVCLTTPCWILPGKNSYFTKLTERH